MFIVLRFKNGIGRVDLNVIHKYIHIYTHSHVYVYIYIYIYIHTRICTHWTLTDELIGEVGGPIMPIVRYF